MTTSCANPTADRAPVVLMVDDEANILSAMRRMLRSAQTGWTCLYASSGAEALDILDRTPVDVVVSDMMMPGMDGATLLTRVKDRRPQTVRIILSGHSDEENALKAVGPAHQYLSKPCDTETLVSVVRRALTLRLRLQRRDLRRVIGTLGDLPSPQKQVSRLLAELDSPTASASSIAALVEQDVAMTADMLRLTNSQYFGLARRITTAQDAVRLLGTETVRALAFKAGLFRIFKGSADLAPVLQAIGQRGLEMAARCRTAARRRRLPPEIIDQAACAGMLWEVGLLALIDRWPDRIRPILDGVAEGAPLGPALRDTFQADQGEVGGYFLALWGFNGTMVEAQTYLETEPPIPPEPDSLTAILREAAAQIETPLCPSRGQAQAGTEIATAG